jgi:hypothetical protein
VGTAKRPALALRNNTLVRRSNHERNHSCFRGTVLSISIRTGRIPAYQRALDHCQSSGRATSPRRTGLPWMEPTLPPPCPRQPDTSGSRNGDAASFRLLDSSILAASQSQSGRVARPEVLRRAWEPPSGLHSFSGTTLWSVAPTISAPIRASAGACCRSRFAPVESRRTNARRTTANPPVDPQALGAPDCRGCSRPYLPLAPGRQIRATGSRIA